MNAFLSKMINCITDYGGDVVKFAGDAVSAIFHPTANSDLREVVERAASCACALHTAVHGFVAWTDPNDPSVSVYLALHIGVGCGTSTVLHLGGDCGRCPSFKSSQMPHVAGTPPARPSGLGGDGAFSTSRASLHPQVGVCSCGTADGSSCDGRTTCRLRRKLPLSGGVGNGISCPTPPPSRAYRSSSMACLATPPRLDQSAAAGPSGVPPLCRRGCCRGGRFYQASPHRRR